MYEGTLRPVVDSLYNTNSPFSDSIGRIMKW